MLTDNAIRTAKPREKPYKMGDSGGLFLLIHPSGGRWWRFKYRVAGKEKLLSFGVYHSIKIGVRAVGWLEGEVQESSYSN